MIDALVALTGFAQAWLAVTYAVFLRVGAAMALLPAFGEQMVPMRLRLALTLSFSAIVIPAAAPLLLVDPDLTAGRFPPFYVVTEVVAGLAIGIGLRLFILALQTAGTIAAQATSLAQLFGGMAAEPQPAISNVFVIGALALAVMAGLHVRLVELFLLSYEIFPAGALPFSADLSAWGVERTASAFALGFTLAAPFVVASMIYNLALGVINRAMPQLMVAFVGAPAITAAALGLMAVSTPLILIEWHRRLEAFIHNPVGGG